MNLRASRIAFLLSVPVLVACAREQAPRPVVLSPAPGKAGPSTFAGCGPRGLPEGQHFVADGLCATAVAHDQGKLRGLTFAPNGDLFAVTSDGEIRRYRDVDGDGVFAGAAPETIVWARTDGENGHNCAFDGQELYCGSKGSVKRWKWSPDRDAGGTGELVVVGIPEGGRHPKLPVGIWDGALHVVSGSEENVPDPMPADYDVRRGVLRRFPLATLHGDQPIRWEDGELFARGLRDLLAYTRDPRGRIVGFDNSFDNIRRGGVDVHDDNPGEPLLVVERGKAYGFPFCFYAQRIDGFAPGTPLSVAALSGDIPGLRELSKTIESPHDDAWCAKNVAPAMSFVQAHSSPIAIAFVPDNAPALPTSWRGAAVVTLHGSWNRNPSTGNKVILVPFDAAGHVAMPANGAGPTAFPHAVIFGGGRRDAPKDGAWGWKQRDMYDDPVRPTGVAFSPKDGALYVSSDNVVILPGRKSGALYRIAIAGQ